MKLKFAILLTLSIFVKNISAQETLLTGNLNFDSQLAFEETKNLSNDDLNLEIAEKRSPLLSAGLSFILPGAGQYYNDDIWKTAIFVAVEAAAIFTAASYNKKGDERTAEFEGFANQNWSVDRYASWTYEKYLANGTFTESEFPRADFFTQIDNKDWTLLNRLENKIGNYYSHRLAPYGDQQYYEMIGKYSQFNPGWNDFQEDIPYSFTYGQKVTDNFLYYAGERAEANDFYTVSKTAVIIVVSNHILSALEAAWSTSRYNKSLELNVSMDKETIGYRTEFIPKLNMKYRISL